MFQVLKEEEINLARKEGAITELQKCCNELYYMLPSGEINAFDLLQKINTLNNMWGKRLKELGGETK